MKDYIFISYAHKDVNEVMPVINKLKENGYRVWYDDEIHPGSEWPEIIADYLIDCKVFFAFITPNYLKSKNCKRELTLAQNKGKDFVAIFLEDVTLSHGMELQLASEQSVFMYKAPDKEVFYRKLFVSAGIETCKDEKESEAVDGERFIRRIENNETSETAKEASDVEPEEASRDNSAIVVEIVQECSEVSIEGLNEIADVDDTAVMQKKINDEPKDESEKSETVVVQPKEVEEIEVGEVTSETVEEEKEVDSKTVEKLLEELNALTGLASVKEKVSKIVSTVQVNKEMEAAGLKSPGFGTLHMVFKGNCGTGKTTVARLLGEIYKALGVLSSGHLVECGRYELVGDYIGSQPKRVKKKVQEALGGVLFIDEAYCLNVGEDDYFGIEAIGALISEIENYRNDLMVIISGCPEAMEVFLRKNQDLSSRFSNEIMFEDYSEDELLSIFKGYLASRGMRMAEELECYARAMIVKHGKASNFGNARGVRNMVESLVFHIRDRICGIMESGRRPTTEELQTVLEEDLRYFL